jgi:hypothetical protein
METTNNQAEKSFIKLTASNSNLQSVIDSVNNSAGSFFSKNDVINLLQGIAIAECDKTDIEYCNLIQHISQVFSDLKEDINGAFEELAQVDSDSLESYELKMNGNEVYIHEVELDVSQHQKSSVKLITAAGHSIVDYLNQL